MCHGPLTSSRKTGSQTVSAGEAGTVLGWTRSLPGDQIAADPLAAHCAAWAAAHSDEPEGLRRWIPAIEAAGHQGPLPDGMRSLTFQPRCCAGSTVSMASA